MASGPEMWSVMASDHGSRDSGAGEHEEISPQRLLEIRLRIATDYYKRPGVRSVTAERILASRDLTSAS